MARKSRKQIAVEEPVIESVSSEVFSTAIYARLSVENSGKSEKVDVIANQIEICKSYIAERPYLNLIDTYVDNGRTGTVFDRPEFNRLMNDIRTGRIKCLVVRDLSRFGRDYIEAGTYLERVFPQIGLRFIAIKENYDNFDADGSGESLIIPLQNMINTLYSKDISRKVSTALKAQMESGEFKKRNLPYGYRWDEEHSNMVFDEETAPIVRKIFQWKIEGLSLPAIADRLDAMNAPNPEFQKYQVGVRTGNATAKKIWNKSSLTTILDNILKNLVYTGTLVSRKMKSCGVGSKKRVVNEPIIVEGTHEAIISKEDFELAQKVIRGGGRNPTRKQHDYPLKGLVRCGNCKRAMTRRKNKAGIRYFQCIHSVNNGNTDCPVGRSFPEMDIEKVVFHALTQFLALAQKEAIQNREVGDLRKSAIKECADKIRTLQKQNEQNKASKLRLYEKYAAGSITKEAYIQQKAAADVKIAENDGAIQRSHERMKELDSETACSDEKLDAVCEQYADCKALTYELTHTFISAVYIYDLDNIEIVWKFKDFLTTSEGEAK